MNERALTVDQYSDRFLRALDSGDLQTLAWLWDEAYQQPVLAQLFTDMLDEAVREFEPADGWRYDIDKVQSLLAQHFPAPITEDLAPLTAGDVASRLQADRMLGGLTNEDVQANTRLLVDATPVPEQLGAPQMERWLTALNISASPRYWKQFRKAAVLLQMSRCQQGAKLQAARRTTGKEQRPT